MNLNYSNIEHHKLWNHSYINMEKMEIWLYSDTEVGRKEKVTRFGVLKEEKLFEKDKEWSHKYNQRKNIMRGGKDRSHTILKKMLSMSSCLSAYYKLCKGWTWNQKSARKILMF